MRWNFLREWQLWRSLREPSQLNAKEMLFVVLSWLCQAVALWWLLRLLVKFVVRVAKS